jgi:pyridoxamine 5'-phosphate oxidase
MSTDDPIARFTALFERAGANAPFDHTAMALGTCGADGQPAVRIVLLHGFDARGFTFYTNYESRKGRTSPPTRGRR